MGSLVILGGGFAGVWAALSAAAERARLGAQQASITLVSKGPFLTIRPRLYEGARPDMQVPLAPLMKKVGVETVMAEATALDPKDSMIALAGRGDIRWDRLVLATGSRLRPPAIAGSELAFSIDTYAEAERLDRHISSLNLADDAAATVVVIGASFTGIELATELRGRLGPKPRIILADPAEAPGSHLGSSLAPIIETALRECGVEFRARQRVTSIDKEGVTFASGETIGSETIILATGMEASPLTRFVPGDRDGLDRLVVGHDLRTPACGTIFAAGDAAQAAADGEHRTLISCQHAIQLGRVAGHNAMRDLLGLDTVAFRQPSYVTCLDLGPSGAAFTQGWDRKIELLGEEGKAMKRRINLEWIYPPSADLGEDPLFKSVAVEELPDAHR